MSQNSDGNEEPNVSVTSSNSDENLLIPQALSGQSYFVEQFNHEDEPKGIETGPNHNPTSSTSPNTDTGGVSSRAGMNADKKAALDRSEGSNEIRFSQISKGTVVSSDSNQLDPCSPTSQRTISTSELINPNRESDTLSQNDRQQVRSNDTRRTSSYYPPFLERTTEEEIIISPHSVTFEKEANDPFQEAVKFLQEEAEAFDTHPTSNEIIKDDDFKPHEYNIIRKASKTMMKTNTVPIPKRTVHPPHSPSLLHKILVPSVLEDIPIEIPALRSVSGSAKASPKLSAPEKFEPKEPIPPQKARIPKITRASDSQIDLTIGILQDYRYNFTANPNNIDLEQNRQPITHSTCPVDENSNSSSIRSLPIQHISSASIRSFDSKKNKFHEIYSLSRIAGILALCFIVPPLFFMVSIGSKGGVSDYRLMKMILNRNHRIGLLKGFIWDIDISWFRNICLLLGTVEILGILACIGSGIGVGIRNQSR